MRALSLCRLQERISELEQTLAEREAEVSTLQGKLEQQGPSSEAAQEEKNDSIEKDKLKRVVRPTHAAVPVTDLLLAR